MKVRTVTQHAKHETDLVAVSVELVVEVALLIITIERRGLTNCLNCKFSSIETNQKIPNNFSASSRSARPRKSPEAAEPTNDTSKRNNYYDERYRSSDRDRDRSDRDRDRDRDHRSRH